MSRARKIRRVVEAVKAAGGRLSAVRATELQLRKSAVGEAVAKGLVSFDELTEDLVYPPEPACSER